MKYTYTTVTPSNEWLREIFNALIAETFGFDFEMWYQNGYWTDDYIPHVLLDKEVVIANVSVSVQPMMICGKEALCIQLGAIATKKEYQNQGLSRFLLEKVLEEWEPKCDHIYLYANDSVVDFYPKFGFVAGCEFQCMKDVTLVTTEGTHQLLTLQQSNQLQLVLEKVKAGNPFSDVYLKGGQSLIMFYLTYFLSDSIYYLPEFDVIMIAEFDNDTLIINEVLGETTTSLDRIVQAMVKSTTKKVILGFSPKDETGFKRAPLEEGNTTFFILSSIATPFDERLKRFPILSRT